MISNDILLYPTGADLFFSSTGLKQNKTITKKKKNALASSSEDTRKYNGILT